MSGGRPPRMPLPATPKTARCLQWHRNARTHGGRWWRQGAGPPALHPLSIRKGEARWRGGAPFCRCLARSSSDTSPLTVLRFVSDLWSTSCQFVCWCESCYGWIRIFGKIGMGCNHWVRQPALLGSGSAFRSLPWSPAPLEDSILAIKEPDSCIDSNLGIEFYNARCQVSISLLKISILEFLPGKVGGYCPVK